jgi:flagellar biosynthesis protein FlhG
MAELKFCCITSGKGGVGKTSLAVNLAFTLARQGHRVLLVDGDLGLANVDVLLGLEVKANVRDVLDLGADPQATVIYLGPNLGILPASSGVPEMANLSPEDQQDLEEVLRVIAAPFDLVLVDTGAGLGPAVLWFNRLAHHSLVVVTPDPTALTDAYALIKVLFQQYRRRHFLVVLNHVQGEPEALQTFSALDRAVKRFLGFTLNYLGAIPTDQAVKLAVRNQVPFITRFPQSKASQAVERLATRLLNLGSDPQVSHSRKPRVQAVT